MAITHHSSEERGLTRMLTALEGVELSEQDRMVLRLIAGWGPDISDVVASLLIRVALAYGTRPAPSEAPAVRAAYDASVSTPGGADSTLAEGLPSYMVLGFEAGPPRTPWWQCRRCLQVRRLGPASTADLREAAEEHLSERHGGAR